MSAPVPISERLGCPTCGAVFRQEFVFCPLDHTSLAPLDHDPLIGATLADRYVIERCVGEGGMGRVYRARHRKLDRLFAVKVLYGDLAASSKMRSRFEREARTASKLDHPRLVSVVDFDVTDSGLLYLAMSYVEGRELAMIIEDEGPLESARIRWLLRQLCEGLGHAHDQGMVHRDFKGQNVLVSGQGASEQVHILDFGLAFMREEPESARLTTQGVVMGTPAYMSPEQAMNQALDHRTDLFSLGVLLYEMLAGTLPFHGTPVEVARQNMAAPPPPIARRVPGLVVDPALEGIAFRLMEKLPRDRFQSAHEVIAALDALAASGEHTRSVPMGALSPRSAVDTGGITQDIHVVVHGGEPLGAAHVGGETTPLASQAGEAPAGQEPGEARAGQGAPGEAPAGQEAGETAQRGQEAGEAHGGQVAAGETAQTVEPAAPAPASMESVEPKPEHVVTERVRPRGFVPRRLAIGAVVAALLALLVWRVSRGPAPSPAESAASVASPVPTEAATVAASGVAAEATTEAAPEATIEAAAEATTEAPAPGADEPASAEPGTAAVATTVDAPAAEQRPRSRPTAPVAAPERDQKAGARAGAAAGAPAGAPAGGDKPPEKPRSEAVGPDLVTLYERVGQKLAAFEGARGKDAATPLWAVYRSIPLADALRTPSLGQEALRKLRKIERDLARARRRAGARPGP